MIKIQTFFLGLIGQGSVNMYHTNEIPNPSITAYSQWNSLHVYQTESVFRDHKGKFSYLYLVQVALLALYWVSLYVSEMTK